MALTIRYFLDGLNQLQQALSGGNGVATTTGVTIFDVNGNPIGSGNPSIVQDVLTEASTATTAAQTTIAATALGTPADASWPGTGNSSVISALKGIWTKIGNVSLLAGNALIGKVGIDQTTPGATNNVTLSGVTGLIGGSPSAVGVNPNGKLEVTSYGTSMFYDGFETNTLDTTNRWNAATTSSGASFAVSGGAASLATGVTPGAYGYIQTLPAFAPVPAAFIETHVAAVMPASIPANTYTFVGQGTVPSTPAAAAPLTNAIGFEWTIAGKLIAVTYASGVRNAIQDCSASSGNSSQPIDGAAHSYRVFVRSDYMWWTIDGVPVAIIKAETLAPTVCALPMLVLVVNNTTAPSTSLILPIDSVWVGDLGNNGGFIRDAVYGFRGANVLSAGAIGNALVVAPQPTNTAATFTNVTVTTGTTLVAASAAKIWLDIQNLSLTATMTLIAGGVTIRILTPLGTYTREGSAIPANAITATSSSGSITAAVGII